MTTGLIGNGYWGTILSKKLNNLQFVADSKTNVDSLKNVDWIFVATPPASHHKIVEYWLNRGSNVFCEKPLCLEYYKAHNLYNLADRLKLKLYVDDIFLHRDEYKTINKARKDIVFKWYKNGPHKDNLINDLLYHDLLILTDLYGIKLLEDIDITTNEKNKLKLSFKYGSINVEVDYVNDYIGEKIKTIVVDDLYRYDFPSVGKDYLKQLIDNCLDLKVNFNKNRKNSLNVVSLLQLFYNYKTFS